MCSHASSSLPSGFSLRNTPATAPWATCSQSSNNARRIFRHHPTILPHSHSSPFASSLATRVHRCSCPAHHPTFQTRLPRYLYSAASSLVTGVDNQAAVPRNDFYSKQLLLSTNRLRPAMQTFAKSPLDTLLPPRTACLQSISRIANVSFSSEDKAIYANAVATLESAFSEVGNPTFSRPPAKPQVRETAPDNAGNTSAAKESRRNTIEDCRFRHFNLCKALPFPSATERGARPLSEDTKLAIAQCLRLGGKRLKLWRQNQNKILREQAQALRHIYRYEPGSPSSGTQISFVGHAGQRAASTSPSTPISSCWPPYPMPAASLTQPSLPACSWDSN